MSKYYDYISQIHQTDTDIQVISTFGSLQISTHIAIDGSVVTNFKNACEAHRQAFISLAPSSTAPPCYVAVHGKWIQITASGTVTTNAATIKVPTGNSGVLVFHLDTTSATVQYKKNSGSYATLADAGTVTVADGDTITIKATSVVEQDFINGSITDQDTGILLDNFSLMNSTPAP